MTTGITSIVTDPKNLEVSFERFDGGQTTMLGEDFLAYLTLAIGAALVVGNGLALLRPQPKTPDGEAVKAPLGRSLIQITVGGLASIWALATILS